MNKFELQGKIKSLGVAYLMWFIVGAHYAYMGRWLRQFFFWITFGGLGIWAIVDLFLMPGYIEDYNRTIYNKLNEIDQQEREERDAAIKSALNNKK